jgi:hypothetical protein
VAAGTPTLRAEELVRNGNFEQGNKEFLSKYKYVQDTILDGFSYNILKNPRDVHAAAPSFGDHTNGKGYMMVVNGGDAPDQVLWAQTVGVRPAEEYTFSLWLTPWYAPTPAELDIRINGKSIGKVVAPDKPGVWKEFKAKWNSGKEKSAAIEIFNLTRGLSGNDFCIDDISLQRPSTLPRGPSTLPSDDAKGLSTLPSDAAKRIKKFEGEAEVIQKKAEADIKARKDELIEDLKALQETYNKAGKLDEAAAIRDRIRQLKAEQEKAKVKD